MRKMLVITREGSRSQEIGDLLDQDTEILTETASDDTRSAGDRDVDTLFVDVESLLGRDTTITKALNGLWAHYPSAAIVVMADEEQTKYAVDAVKAGAFDYLTHPIEKAELGLIVDKVRESDVLQSELDYLRGQFWSEDFLDYVDTRSKNMRDVFVKTRQVAGTRSTVLLTGETGTGKSLIAKLIHAHSNRKHMPFISVHCGAIPDTLVESELFGHEKGAFTGAVRRKLGKFELAHGGTIFLDEIGTVSQSVQVKLLNVIQERMIQRVGGENDTPVDVRIIAATNEDMGELCEKGKFRRDLFLSSQRLPHPHPPASGQEGGYSQAFRIFHPAIQRICSTRKSRAFTHRFWTRSWSTSGRETSGNLKTSSNAPASLKLATSSCRKAFPRTCWTPRERSSPRR